MLDMHRPPSPSEPPKRVAHSHIPPQVFKCGRSCFLCGMNKDQLGAKINTKTKAINFCEWRGPAAHRQMRGGGVGSRRSMAI